MMLLPERRRMAAASPETHLGPIEETSARDVPERRTRDAGEPLPAAGPQDGDIVVTRESMSPVRLSVSQVPTAVQLNASSRQEAEGLAKGFARKHRVDVWYREAGVVRLLEAYRRRRAPGLEPEAGNDAGGGRRS